MNYRQPRDPHEPNTRRWCDPPPAQDEFSADSQMTEGSYSQFRQAMRSMFRTYDRAVHEHKSLTPQPGCIACQRDRLVIALEIRDPQEG